MPLRTNSSAVAGVLSNDYDGTTVLTPYMLTANAIVNRVSSCASAKGESVSSEELELMERWLAAHCYCASDQPYSARSTNRASGQFQGQTGMHLEATKYGQMALTLDFTGCLVQVTTQNTAGGFWLGRRPSEQTDFLDRD